MGGDPSLRRWRTPCGRDLELVLVPAGPVVLGREDGPPDERPPHVRELAAPFWIARRPVSRALWRAFAAATGRPGPRRSWWPWSPGEEDPVAGVSWDEARAFCAWAGLALPIEAEWERAAALREPERPPVLALPAFPVAGGAAFPHLAATALLAGPAPPPGPRFVEGLGEWCEDRYSARAYLASALGAASSAVGGERRLARTPRDGPRARWAHLPHDRSPTIGLRPVLRLDPHRTDPC